jgi:hypothetical protein
VISRGHYAVHVRDLWDLRQLRRFPFRENQITGIAAAVLPGGEPVVAVRTYGLDNAIEVLGLVDGRRRSRLLGHTGLVAAVALPDRTLVLVPGEGNSIRVHTFTT